MRLEKEKELEADARLSYYYWRKRFEPSYDYPDRHEDLLLTKRKMKEAGGLLVKRGA
jgi:hypothetical protein